MAGGSTCLPALQGTDTVLDIARSIRSKLGVPISVQQLAWGSVALREPSERLDAIFQGTRAAAVTLVRRPFTPAERSELHRRLVRATAAGDAGKVRELLREGAQVNFDPEPAGNDTSAELGHWDEVAEAEAEQRGNVGQAADIEPRDSDEEAEHASSDGHSSSSEDGAVALAGRPAIEPGAGGEQAAVADRAHPCGGLSPLLVALVAGRADLADDFRQLGAQDVSLTPSATADLQEAFCREDFPEIARHMAQGADLNVLMPRGRGLHGAPRVWSIWPGVDHHFGAPLHACAAMHQLPGAYEAAQLLMELRADLNAGDAEGDTPLAHARYFRARAIHDLYMRRGAVLAGPYYSRTLHRVQPTP